MPKDGTKNLIPFNQRSKDEVREINRRGGINSGKTRRQNSVLRKQLRALLNLPLKPGKKTEILRSFEDLKNSNPSMNVIMLAKLVQFAAGGDLDAMKLIYEISGERAENAVMAANAAELEQDAEATVESAKVYLPDNKREVKDDE